jgi:hypothetical protein
MKKLNKHPRLFKKTATTLKKLIETKIKSMRSKKLQNQCISKISSNVIIHLYKKVKARNTQIKKDNKVNNMNHMKVIEPFKRKYF